MKMLLAPERMGERLRKLPALQLETSFVLLVHLRTVVSSGTYASPLKTETPHGLGATAPDPKSLLVVTHVAGSGVAGSHTQTLE